jgi:site-specific DNA recombinase
LRTAVYVRLSRDRSGLSENLAIQRTDCEEHAQAQGWEVVAVYEDNDLSASRYARNHGRPSYQRMLAAIKAGEVEAVLVTEMPRLYRRLEELLELIYLAEATPFRLIETVEGGGYNLSTAEGIHNAVSAVNNAVLETRRFSDRMKRKKRAQAREGRFGGGVRPFGYEADGVTVRESEAAIIREVAERIIAGESLYHICRDLHDRSIVGSTGQPFQRHTVKRLMTNKRIIGIRTHNRNAEYPAQWPAILDRETWNRVQIVLQAGHRLTSMAPTKGRRTYLLTGMIYCGRPDCGARMIGQGANGVRKYGCRGDQVVKRASFHLSRHADPVEALVSEAVLRRLDSPPLARFLAEDHEELGELQDQYFAQKARLDGLITDYATGLLNREQLALAKTAAEEALDSAKRKLAKMEHNHVLASIPAGTSVREAWDGADTDWRRALIALVVERVTILPGRPGEHTWRAPDGKRYYFQPEHVRIVWRV